MFVELNPGTADFGETLSSNFRLIVLKIEVRNSFNCPEIESSNMSKDGRQTFAQWLQRLYKAK
jgi:hypothetical protein